MDLANGIHEGNRFNDRVEDYRRYRPRYPKEILGILEDKAGLRSNSRIADIAAGTGLFTELFLEHGNPVIAVEPNAQMRDVCGSLKARYPRLHVVNGTVEATGIAAHSFDVVTVGQAFHWFDTTAARSEFQRVLDLQGWVVIVSNERFRFGDPFHDGLERPTQRHNVDYGSVTERYPSRDALGRFFLRSLCTITQCRTGRCSIKMRCWDAFFLPRTCRILSIPAMPRCALTLRTCSVPTRERVLCN